MLTGASLSEVQEVGLQMLMIMDQRRDATRFVEDLRARLVATHPDKVRDLFPEWFAAESVDIDGLDGSEVEWSVPETPEAREELERWIATHSAGIISASEIGGDWM